MKLERENNLSWYSAARSHKLLIADLEGNDMPFGIGSEKRSRLA
jgi:hypothetical protein